MKREIDLRGLLTSQYYTLLGKEQNLPTVGLVGTRPVTEIVLEMFKVFWKTDSLSSQIIGDKHDFVEFLYVLQQFVGSTGYALGQKDQTHGPIASGELKKRNEEQKVLAKNLLGIYGGVHAALERDDYINKEKLNCGRLLIAVGAFEFYVKSDLFGKEIAKIDEKTAPLRKILDELVKKESALSSSAQIRLSSTSIDEKGDLQDIKAIETYIAGDLTRAVDIAQSIIGDQDLKTHLGATRTYINFIKEKIKTIHKESEMLKIYKEAETEIGKWLKTLKITDSEQQKQQLTELLALGKKVISQNETCWNIKNADDQLLIEKYIYPSVLTSEATEAKMETKAAELPKRKSSASDQEHQSLIAGLLIDCKDRAQHFITIANTLSEMFAQLQDITSPLDKSKGFSLSKSARQVLNYVENIFRLLSSYYRKTITQTEFAEDKIRQNGKKEWQEIQQKNSQESIHTSLLAHILKKDVSKIEKLAGDNLLDVYKSWLTLLELLNSMVINAQRKFAAMLILPPDMDFLKPFSAFKDTMQFHANDSKDQNLLHFDREQAYLLALIPEDCKHLYVIPTINLYCHYKKALYRSRRLIAAIHNGDKILLSTKDKNFKKNYDILGEQIKAGLREMKKVRAWGSEYHRILQRNVESMKKQLSTMVKETSETFKEETGKLDAFTQLLVKLEENLKEFEKLLLTAVGSGAKEDIRKIYVELNAFWGEAVKMDNFEKSSLPVRRDSISLERELSSQPPATASIMSSSSTGSMDTSSASTAALISAPVPVLPTPPVAKIPPSNSRVPTESSTLRALTQPQSTLSESKPTSVEFPKQPILSSLPSVPLPLSAAEEDRHDSDSEHDFDDDSELDSSKNKNKSTEAKENSSQPPENSDNEASPPEAPPMDDVPKPLPEVSSIPSQTSERGDLLAAIRAGKKLKKVETNETPTDLNPPTSSPGIPGVMDALRERLGTRYNLLNSKNPTATRVAPTPPEPSSPSPVPPSPRRSASSSIRLVGNTSSTRLPLPPTPPPRITPSPLVKKT